MAVVQHNLVLVLVSVRIANFLGLALDKARNYEISTDCSERTLVFLEFVKKPGDLLIFVERVLDPADSPVARVLDRNDSPHAPHSKSMRGPYHTPYYKRPRPFRTQISCPP
jgi:hypothetical protein